MKKIILCFFAAVSLTSCLDKPSYESSYPLVGTFDFTNGSQAQKELFGEDSVYFDSQFQLADIVFNNAKEGSSFNGFAWSLAANKTDDYTQYSVYDKSGVDGSNGFLLFYNNPTIKVDHHVIFPYAAYGTFTPLSCYIHNTTSVAKEILGGFNKFERGDSLKLIATGYLNGEPTGSAGIMLADYRQKDSLVTTWTEFKLDKLGNVEFIDFSFMSSKPVPEYFCMDNFRGNVAISVK